MKEKYNRIGLTCISFLSYALTGALIVVTGVILEKISLYFNIPITKMSTTFTFLNAGILIAVFLNSWLINFISLKTQLILGFLLIVISTIILIFNHNLILFSFNMLILGIVSGITMSIGTFFITTIYSKQKRASMLLLTDSCFSMSGMIFPIITALLISNNIPWYVIYIIISVIYLIIFILTINLTFPHIYLSKNTKITKKWNSAIFYLSISALLYILGQLSFISWIPEYTMKHIHLNIYQSGQLVSNFWMAYMIGMWVFSFILKYFNLKNILIILTGTSTLLMFLFNTMQKYLLLVLTITLLGFFSSAIYTIIITLASQQTKKPSPKIINIILTSGTVGTLLTFIITGPIVQKYGIIMTLYISNILYCLVFILSILFNTKKNNNSKLNQ